MRKESEILVVNQMVLLFGLMALGYLLKKIRILDTDADNKLSRLVVNVAIPASILQIACRENTLKFEKTLLVLAIAVGIFLAIPLLSKGIIRLTGWNSSCEMMLNYSNVGFMGLPITEALFGAEYVIYTAIFMMVFNLSIFSYGVATLTGGRGAEISWKRMLLSPATLAALITLPIFFSPFTIPAAPAGLIGSVAGITTPLAMMLIGSMLAAVRFREVLTDRRLYLLALIKMVLYPALVYGVLQFFISDPIILGTATLLTGLPVAGNVSMLCVEYDGDQQLAAKGTFLTSLFSVVTVPVFFLLFGGR